MRGGDSHGSDAVARLSSKEVIHFVQDLSRSKGWLLRPGGSMIQEQEQDENEQNHCLHKHPEGSLHFFAPIVTSLK